MLIGPALGDVGKFADAGAELDGPSPREAEPMESLYDAAGSVEAGVHCSCDVAESRLEGAMGRNRSRVRSKVSEPMALMAAEYLSRRILDSLTKKSANNRTLSASLDAAASLSAKARNRSTAAAANWFAFCVTILCLDTGVVTDAGGREPSRGRDRDADRV